MNDIKKVIELEKKLYEYTGDDRIITSHELKKEIDAIPANEFVYKTGIKSLDRILSNVESGELVVVSGPTGNGKTTLLIDITRNIASNTPSAWFTLEVTQRQFLGKFGDNLPLFYTPAKNTENNIQWLIERIIEAKVKHDVKMVFVDHLHQIFSIDKFNGKNLSLELGDIVAKLKQLAIEYNLVIWLVAHSTDPKDAVTREPRMSDIRDSGMIPRLADTVIGVWRVPNTYTGDERTIEESGEDDVRAKIRIWKNRRTGKVGYFMMDFLNGAYQEVDYSITKNPPLSKYKQMLLGKDD